MKSEITCAVDNTLCDALSHVSLNPAPCVTTSAAWIELNWYLISGKLINARSRERQPCLTLGKYSSKQTSNQSYSSQESPIKKAVLTRLRHGFGLLLFIPPFSTYSLSDRPSVIALQQSNISRSEFSGKEIEPDVSWCSRHFGPFQIPSCQQIERKSYHDYNDTEPFVAELYPWTNMIPVRTSLHWTVFLPPVCCEAWAHHPAADEHMRAKMHQHMRYQFPVVLPQTFEQLKNCENIPFGQDNIMCWILLFLA